MPNGNHAAEAEWTSLLRLPEASGVCVCVSVGDGLKKGCDLQSRFSHLVSPVFCDAVERMGRSRPVSFRCPVGVPDVGSSIYPWFRPAPLQITVRRIVNTAR